MNIRSASKWLYSHSATIHTSLFVSSLMRTCSIACSLLFIYVSKVLIDIVTGKSDAPLNSTIALLIACVLVQIIFSVYTSRIETLASVRIKNKLREILFSRAMIARWQGRGTHHSGDLTNRLIEDVRVVGQMLCTEIPNLVSTCFQLLGAFIFLLYLEPKLAIILMAVMPVTLLLSRLFAKRLRKLTLAIRSTDSKVQSHIQESIQNNQQIRALNQTSRIQGGLNSLQSDLEDNETKRLNFSLTSRAVVNFGFTAGYVTAFLWGALGIRDGAVTFGMMTAFLQLVAQIQRPAVELSRLVPTFINGFASAERIIEVASLPGEEQGEQKIMQGSLAVCFDNVSFRYAQGERLILSDFSARFPKGKITALIGETGAGKSTIIKLILALIVPDKGALYLEGESEKVKCSPLTRANITYVPQGGSLMSGTIRDNLLLGNSNATNEQLEWSLKVAAAEFVFDLPQSLDTICGEKGVGLSEGQAQRIAIARAMLRPSPVILLDEPTSALDLQTETTLLDRLRDNIEDRCVVMITHQQSAIDFADNIVKLSKI